MVEVEEGVGVISHAAGRRILPHGKGGAVAGSTRGKAHEEESGTQWSSWLSS